MWFSLCTLEGTSYITSVRKCCFFLAQQLCFYIGDCFGIFLNTVVKHTCVKQQLRGSPWLAGMACS